MQNQRGLGKTWIAIAGWAALGVILFETSNYLGKTDPPGLQPGSLTDGQLSLTVTNGTNNEFYEIYTVSALWPTNVTWLIATSGIVGQTNFWVPINTNLEPSRFWKARAGNDWDGDGTQNWKDADPNDPSIHELSVRIRRPTNGATIY